MEVEAINRANAKTGDLVMISFGTAPLMKVYSLVYIFPIVALLAGAVLGQWLSHYISADESLLSLLLGLLFFGGAFLIIKYQGNRMAKQDSYQPKILQILSARQSPPE
jgi:sigma-E factor negative regulatory protein RseC